MDDPKYIYTWAVPENSRLNGKEKESYKKEDLQILYLISLYGVSANSPQDSESWIREVPLMVLIYELIIHGVVDLDYGPTSLLFCYQNTTCRMWVNISQEGKSVIDRLRESELLNGLKLTSKSFDPITALQVSHRGVMLLQECKDLVRAEVDKILYQKKITSPENLVRCDFDEDKKKFRLFSDSGTLRISSITDTEDVSYVVSPYLPKQMRHDESIVMKDNKRRVNLLKRKDSNLKDTLDELITLNSVTCLQMEWAPFGANQLFQLNERLGVLDRCKGGMFSSAMDSSGMDSQLKVKQVQTRVSILDCNFGEFTNIEAEYFSQHDDANILQVETFGINVNVGGNISTGVYFNSIMEKGYDVLSLDVLSRVMVDIQNDSTQIIDDLFTSYQHNLLSVVNNGDSKKRRKYYFIVADRMDPPLPAARLMDRGPHEDELKQIIGNLYDSWDVNPSTNDVIVLGKGGLIVAGPHARDLLHILLPYAQLLTREIFLSDTFTRLLMLDNNLERVKSLQAKWSVNIANMSIFREELNKCSGALLSLIEILGYFTESLPAHIEIPDLDKNNSMQVKLVEKLKLEKQLHDISVRAHDLKKLLDGMSKKVYSLQLRSNSINKESLDESIVSIESKFRTLVDSSAAQARSSKSLEIMQIILAGGLFFKLFDRLTYSGVGDTDVDFSPWLTEAFRQVDEIPMMYFFINLVWFLSLSMALRRFMKNLNNRTLGSKTYSDVCNLFVDVDKLNKYLKGKEILTFDTLDEGHSKFLKVVWVDENKALWKGETPKITILCNAINSILLQVSFEWLGPKTPLTKGEFMEVFRSQLVKHHCLIEGDLSTVARETVEKDTAEAMSKIDEMSKVEDHPAVITVSAVELALSVKAAGQVKAPGAKIHPEE